MSLEPAGSYRKTRGIIRRGARASQPAANTVLEGTIYYVTDEDKLERSNGSSWQSYGNAALVIGGANTQVQFNDSGVLGGDAGLTYDKTTDILSVVGGYKERSRTIPLGEWVNVAFDAGNFAGSDSMTWTVESADQLTFQYTLIGKTLIINVDINATTVGGTPSNLLLVTIPGGFTANKSVQVVYRATDNGTTAIAVMSVAASGTVMRFSANLLGTSWSLSTNATRVQAQIAFEVQ